MLWMLLAVANPSGAVPPTTIASIQELDKTCSVSDEASKPLTLALTKAELAIGPTSSKERGLRRALLALDGQVLVHWVDPPKLEWNGPVARTAAFEAFEKGEALAWVRGRLARGSEFPACFGHPQVDFRSVSMKIAELVVSDPQGMPMGRLSPVPEHPLPSPGGTPEIMARCGTPCAHTEDSIKTAVAKIEDNLIKCAQGAPAGSLVLELWVASRTRSSSIRGEVATLPEKVRSCAREMVQSLRLPSRSKSGALLVEVRVPVAGKPKPPPSKPSSKSS